MNCKVFCVLTYGRAGSKLFQSLLDWHPQIMSFPRTLQFQQFWKKVSHKKDNPGFLVDTFIKEHPRFFSGKTWTKHDIKYDKADQLGPNMNETFYVDTESFRKNALEELKDKEITRARLFIALHRAYHASCDRGGPESPLIFYHIHAMEHIEDVKACLKDFPNDAYILVITRHPVESLRSLVNIMKIRNTLSCSGIFFQQRRVLRYVSRLGNLSGVNIRSLTYEQFLSFPEQVMRAFTDWVKIKWNDSLMRGTMHGKLWWGNSDIPRNSIAPGWKLYKPSGLMERKDRIIFSNIAYSRMGKLGYLDESDTERKLRKGTLLLLLLLPTSAELCTLKSMFSPRYWKGIKKRIREDIDNSYLDGGLSKRLVYHMRIFNPFKWIFFYFMRTAYYYQFALMDRGNRESVPEPLIKKSVRWES